MSKAKVSLVDFARVKRQTELRATCTVCQLPAEVREQLRLARPKKIPRPVVLAWLADAGHAVSSGAMDTHNQGKHDIET